MISDADATDHLLSFVSSHPPTVRLLPNGCQTGRDGEVQVVPLHSGRGAPPAQFSGAPGPVSNPGQERTDRHPQPQTGQHPQRRPGHFPHRCCHGVSRGVRCF